ncbi:FecR family protein [Novosphingobium sediminicola]|uniref:Transmembrane sensor n=1 Tax=Novosphingobium sediminicola TaxID=563162 RepID=A0A7W6CLR4_9SPHN|nr:FecR domain-containing protein [Novosphingobium sediminicola]MBB3953797.1 transmembrane sensor [Novosphingobium sediminicola]
MSMAFENSDDAVAYWVARIDAGDLTPEETARWQMWLDEDPSHRGKLLRTQAIWMSLSQTEDQAAPEDEAPVRAPLWQRRSFLGGAAAAGLAAVGGAYFLLDRDQTFSTRKGEVRRVPLIDGSAMTMNSDTGVSVRMERNRRMVSLARGEAWFEVAKDPARPFVVNAGNMVTRAVGTAFSVRRHENAVEVMVTEGVVETWSPDRADQRLRLKAGQRVVATDSAIIHYRPSQSEQVERALAWRTGEIDLAGNTLADAAEEFNRYNTRQLLIADPEISGEQIAGVFRMNDPMGFAEAVKASLDLKVDISDPTVIRLERKTR